ncbi:MAG: 4'-phosphopantetheinyl transferase superfamily protein [Clostridia bacterium]|nr:4'-phosphopantetheinyl transferase superfamily protein [Clostridia bacterium]
MKPIVYVLKNKYGLADAQRRFLLSHVSEYKKKRISNVQSPEKADAMLLAESLLKCAASKEFGIPMESLTISRKQGGKPYFVNFANIHFSISHGDEYVAVALCDRPVGIDIQKIGNFPKKVAERICSNEEYETLLEDTASSILFTKLWTRKEAVLKMKGIGIFSGEIRTALNHQNVDSTRIEDYWLSVAVSDYEAR